MQTLAAPVRAILPALLANFSVAGTTCTIRIAATNDAAPAIAPARPGA